MKPLPEKIYRAAQIREMDRLAIEAHNIPGYTLMCRAGDAAYKLLRKRWPWARRVLVLCGAGNNAGDGYVIARLAQADNLDVTTVALFDPGKLDGDAQLAWETYHAAGGEAIEWTTDLCGNADIIVDAILGTGLTRPLARRSRDVVEQVNESGLPVMAVDLPTGLHADTGQVMGAAVRAEVTVTFIGLKLGLYTGEGWEYAGEILFEDLGVARLVGQAMPYAGQRIDSALVGQVLPQRARTMHKGRAGHVLVVGGDIGMPGAVRLAAEASLRSGAGLVTVATRAENIQLALGGRPELMGRGVEKAADLRPLLKRAGVVAVGPGLGMRKWGRLMLDTLLDTELPLVVDADALNLLAERPVRRDNWVLTPHPGEAGTLLGISAEDVQADRFTALARLLERYGGNVVLKGAGTLVGRVGDVPWVCDRGNPGMAAPGMGDVLTGVVAGVAAQSGDLFAASRAAVWVHGAAGDSAAVAGERGLAASDLFPWIVHHVNAKP